VEKQSQQFTIPTEHSHFSTRLGLYIMHLAS